jgi:hypothetical protein
MEKLKNLVRESLNESLNSSEIVNIINRAYTYKREVLDFKFPEKFVSKNIKNYTSEDFEKDLRILKNFDINLLWNKPFWGLHDGDSNSISAVATDPYTKLKKLLS